MALLILALAIAIFALPLAVARARRDPWGPDADKPIGYQLTDRGLHAIDHPTDYVLDEDTETWGPPA
jgi:hypothetical protein